MRTKTIALKCLIHFLGILSIILVLSSRNVGGLGAFMVRFAGAKEIGDTGGIVYFRQNKKFSPLRNKASLKDADVIVFGDSFGHMPAGGEAFPARLQELLSAPVFWKYRMRSKTVAYRSPLEWLEETDPSEIRATILIYLITERSINGDFLNCEQLISQHRTSKVDDGVTEDDNTWKWSDICEILFDNSKLEYVAKECYPTRWGYEASATGKFFLLHKTSNLHPQYSIVPRMLYYYDDINAFNQSLESKNIEDVVSSSVRFRDILMERYGMHFVFVPVPTQYTIYHDHGDPDSKYNGFLPLLTEKLDEKGVICVNLYPTFMKERSRILYWSDDTHWNGKGVEIAAALTKAKIRENNLLGRYTVPLKQ